MSVRKKYSDTVTRTSTQSSNAQLSEPAGAVFYRRKGLVPAAENVAEKPSMQRFRRVINGRLQKVRALRPESDHPLSSSPREQSCLRHSVTVHDCCETIWCLQHLRERAAFTTDQRFKQSGETNVQLRRDSFTKEARSTLDAQDILRASLDFISFQ